MTDTYVLRELTFEITRKCPMRCILCSSEGGTAHHREFSLNKIKRIIDEAIELGTQHVNLSGGEPLIHPDITRICEYIKNNGLTVDVYTCGNIEDPDGHLVPINQHLLNSLKKISIDRLIFGIHGSNSMTHDMITTKKDSFNNLMKSITTASELGLFTEVHFVPTKLNYKSLSEVMRFIDKLQVERLSILRFIPQGRGRINRHNLELDYDEQVELKNILHEIRNKYPISKFRAGSPFNCFQLSNPTFCTAGVDKATIKPNGLVFPCVSMKDFVIEEDNNLWDKKLSDIWQKSTIFGIIRKSLKIIEEESECKYCAYFLDCRGGCLAQRLIWDMLDKRDPYCMKQAPSVEINTGKREILTVLGE